MDLWFLALVGILFFALLTLCRKWYDYAMLFTFAIGFAVNANIYNSVTAPVNFYKLIFSIDSILYTGFTFTVIICAKEYGVRKGKILTSSAIGTFVGIWVMLYIFDKLNKKNVNIYLIFFICVLISSIINSTIYYSYYLIAYQNTTNFLYILLGSYIGKLYAIMLGLISYAINKHLWIPNDLKEDEEVENYE